MRDKYQGEATDCIRRNRSGEERYWTYKYKDARFVQGVLLPPEWPGGPDMQVQRNGRFAYVEVKNGTDSFKFDDFEENKREFVHEKAIPLGLPYWMFLVLGNGVPTKTSITHRRAWLFPIQRFFEIEFQIKPIQGTLPLLAGKGYRTELQERKLDAVHLLAQYELEFIKGSNGSPWRWTVQDEHDFHKIFMEAGQWESLPKAS